MAAAVLFRLIKTMLALRVLLVLGGLSSSQSKIISVELEPTEDSCPPCELLFRKLEKNEETGKLTQVVRVQERGEPKSGTGLMLDWATGALDHTCIYLQRLYGKESCVFDVKPGEVRDGNLPARPVTRRMVFEPALGASELTCPCETIESVSIVLSKDGKHSLPVKKRCAFSHNRGIELARDETDNRRQTSACTFADGSRPTNNDGLWQCMQQANCDITDDWLQLVVFRDPRPVVVSTYFFLKAHSDKEVGNLEDFIARELPIICEYMAVRHILFSGFLPHQSIGVWYNDAIADPLEWHYHYFDSIGLQLPFQTVNDAAEDAAGNNLRFTPNHVDEHPGETPRTDTSVRKFEDEVSSETIKVADDILRQWLPPVLLAKLGVEPTEEETV